MSTEYIIRNFRKYIPNMPTESPAATEKQKHSKCCIADAVHFWSPVTARWTTSEQPGLPKETELNTGKSCLAAINMRRGPGVRVILAEAEKWGDGASPCHSGCRKHFQSSFNMPDVWFEESSRKSNGYFGCDTLTDENGNLTGITTWCRFIIKLFDPDDESGFKESGKDYWWDKLNMFTKWEAGSNMTTIIFLLRSRFKEQMFPQEYFQGITEMQLEDPFWMYSYALSDISHKQNTSVWAVRTRVRDKEKASEKKNGKKLLSEEDSLEIEQSLDYRSLHDLARHTIHGTETLEATLAVVELLVQEHASLKDILQSPTPMPPSTPSEHFPKASAAVIVAAHRKQHSSLLFRLSALRSLLHRSNSTKERLLNEINLVFNTVAKDDANTSHQLADAARIDSAAMKTIAYVTTAFLPATFIAAVFSTSFFNFEQGKGWDVSGYFWIYWICAVPVTIVAVVALEFWQRRFVRKGKALTKRKSTYVKTDVKMASKESAGSEGSQLPTYSNARDV